MAVYLVQDVCYHREYATCYKRRSVDYAMQPLEHILAYFHDIAGVPVMTSNLEQALSITSRPVAHGGLADIYQAKLADGSLVAAKCLRQKPEGDKKELKVRLMCSHISCSFLIHMNALSVLLVSWTPGRNSTIRTSSSSSGLLSYTAISRWSLLG